MSKFDEASIADQPLNMSPSHSILGTEWLLNETGNLKDISWHMSHKEKLLTFIILIVTIWDPYSCSNNPHITGQYDPLYTLICLKLNLNAATQCSAVQAPYLP